MPELPDIVAYVEALERRIVGKPLETVRIRGPFVVRSVEPPISSAAGHKVTGTSRLGKRIVIALDGDLFIVIHLMIAGRLLWKPRGAPLTNRISLAAFDFSDGAVVLTEAGTTKRASIHLLHGREQLIEFDRGGLEVLTATLAQFAERLRSENHTLKRSLTDPRLF